MINWSKPMVRIKLFMAIMFFFGSLSAQEEINEVLTDSLASEMMVESDVDDVIAKEASGWNLGITGSVGFINGEYIKNTPVGASFILTTPYGFKLGALDFQISLAAGSYSGETPKTSEYSPLALGVGGNLTLFNFLFYEGHVGLVGAGAGGRGFGGISLESVLKKGLGLPVNILIGAEGFISSKLEDSGEEASYWGGLGIRLDYGF